LNISSWLKHIIDMGMKQLETSPQVHAKTFWNSYN